MSIPSSEVVVNEQDGVLESHVFNTRPENLHILYDIARNQLYSDEIMALLREYGINAMDIHVAVGTPELPIVVTLPTQFDPVLKIRDFGTGLDSEGIKEYVSFGASSKRGDPLQTGQLGIGCKCGFTYGDSFIVKSYYNGRLSVWNAYKDPSEQGKIDKLMDEPTNEPLGIEIEIPIRPEDIQRVHEKAMFLFAFASVVPNFVNATPEDLLSLSRQRHVKPLFEGEKWKYTGSQKSFVVMGNIPYPLSSDCFSEDEVAGDIRMLLDGGLIITLSNGEVDFAASREQLKYTPKTKGRILTIVGSIVEELSTKCQETINNCGSLWEARLLQRAINRTDNPLFRLRRLLSRKGTYKGFSVGGAFEIDSTPFVGRMTCFRYAKRSSGYSPSSPDSIVVDSVRSIEPREDCVVVINDTHLRHGIKLRMNGLLNERTTVAYLLDFSADDIKKQWFLITGLDCPVIALSTLPKVPFELGGTTSPISKERASLYANKVFKYNPEGQASVSRGSRQLNSCFWISAPEIDISRDSGVYVLLDRFEIVPANGGTNYSPYKLTTWISELKAFGIQVPEIIGIKFSLQSIVQGNTNMITFETWARQEIKKCLDNDFRGYSTKYANQKALIEFCRATSYNANQASAEWFCMQHSITDENHRLHTFFKQVQEVMSFAHWFEKIVEWKSRFQFEFKYSPSIDLSQEYRFLSQRYPIVFLFLLHAYDRRMWKEGLAEYVQIIDKTYNEHK